jgi:diguanylate cyclase (GGDEF)-like protein
MIQAGIHCSVCGSPMQPDDNYCSNCATGRDDPTTRALFVVDGTTGLFNQAFTGALVDHETSRAVRYKRPLTALVGMIDHSEFIANDLGPARSADLLHELGEVMAGAVRDIDTVGYLGDRYCVVLPETDQPGAMVAADKIMHAVAAHQYSAGRGQWERITISMGLASVNPDRMGRQDLIEMATLALLEGRSDGSNKIHLHNQMS